MAAPKTITGLWSQYLAARVAEMAVTMRRPASNLRWAMWAGQWLHRLDRRHRLRAHRHLLMAMPELSEARRDQLVRDSFEHLARLVVELMHTPRQLNRDSWTYRMKLNLDELGPAVDRLNHGRPMLLLTGHVGNWEAMGTLLALLGYPIHALARPLDNRLINAWLTGIREKRGLRLVTKFDATDRMVEIIEAGGTLGFIADQNAGDRGMFVPFFGKLASTYKSIGLLAINFNLPIVCGYALRTSQPLEFQLGAADIILPEQWADQPDPLYYVTARYVRALELMIRRDPAQYLWLHRRWKSRPRHERDGKPMPAGLRRNIEALPWMDEATMRRLLEPVPDDVRRRR